MSRGFGKVQKTCLRVLREQDYPEDSITIASLALGKDSITTSEHSSYRRALRKLARAGLVVDMGRNWRRGRRHWALPEVAERSLKWMAAMCERRP